MLVPFKPPPDCRILIYCFFWNFLIISCSMTLPADAAVIVANIITLQPLPLPHWMTNEHSLYFIVQKSFQKCCYCSCHFKDQESTHFLECITFFMVIYIIEWLIISVKSWITTFIRSERAIFFITSPHSLFVCVYLKVMLQNISPFPKDFF